MLGGLQCQARLVSMCPEEWSLVGSSAYTRTVSFSEPNLVNGCSAAIRSADDVAPSLSVSSLRTAATSTFLFSSLLCSPRQLPVDSAPPVRTSNAARPCRFFEHVWVQISGAAQRLWQTPLALSMLQRVVNHRTNPSRFPVLTRFAKFLHFAAPSSYRRLRTKTLILNLHWTPWYVQDSRGTTLEFGFQGVR